MGSTRESEGHLPRRGGEEEERNKSARHFQEQARSGLSGEERVVAKTGRRRYATARRAAAYRIGKTAYSRLDQDQRDMGVSPSHVRELSLEEVNRYRDEVSWGCRKQTEY